MNCKIIPLDHLNEEKEPALPVDLEEILKNIKAIPSYILEEYTEVIQNRVEDLLFCKNVLSARDSPNLFQNLTEGMTNDQIERFSHIASYLSAEDCLKNAKEIITETFGYCAATQENSIKSAEFIEWIKSLKINDYKERAENLTKLSNNIQIIADILSLLSEGDKFNCLLKNRLAESYFDQLNNLIQIGYAVIKPSSSTNDTKEF